ncbi:MAG: transglutaminase domain-containing protein [Thermodesulfobacteriota bacterium]
MQRLKSFSAQSIPILGTGLAFWGYEGGLVWLGVPLAFLLEAALRLPRRAEFSNRDFIRISDLCAVLLVGMVALLVVTLPMREAALTIFQLLPLPLYPLMLAQAVSVQGKVPMGTVVWSARNLKPGEAFRGVDITYPFLALCLLCGSLSNHREGGYYLGFAAVGAIALWRFRAREAARFAWAGMFLAALLAGFMGYRCLEDLQAWLERVTADWYYEYLSRDTDPFKAITAIGEIGELHLSNRPVLRVQPLSKRLGPLLLRQATYDTFHSGSWVATQAGFAEVEAGSAPGSWVLSPVAEGPLSLRVLLGLRKDRGLLPLPGDSSSLSDLQAGKVKENRLGTVMAEEAPGLLCFFVRQGARGSDGPPTPTDLIVPENEEQTFSALADDLGLSRVPETEAVRRVKDYFTKNFSYSLKLSGGNDGNTPLARFLLASRQGHCELFATATVLLLREAGIHARYATGYLASEPSGVKNWLVVRERHSHAWARVFVNGSWTDADTTPPGWVAEEDEGVGVFAQARDILSRFWFRFTLFRSGLRTEELFPYAAGVVLLLAGFLFFRIFRRRWVPEKRTRREDAGDCAARPGIDSEFFRVLARWQEEQGPRSAGETPAGYLRRAEKQAGRPLDERLLAALQLHYRYRFDPRGLDSASRARLSRLVAEILGEAPGNSGGDDFRGRESEPQERILQKDP